MVNLRENAAYEEQMDLMRNYGYKDDEETDIADRDVGYQCKILINMYESLLILRFNSTTLGDLGQYWDRSNSLARKNYRVSCKPKLPTYFQIFFF